MLISEVPDITCFFIRSNEIYIPFDCEWEKDKKKEKSFGFVWYVRLAINFDLFFCRCEQIPNEFTF